MIMNGCYLSAKTTVYIVLNVTLACAPATTAFAAPSAACATLHASAETAGSPHFAHAGWEVDELLPLLLPVLMLR
jgi:hypothetical protein